MDQVELRKAAGKDISNLQSLSRQTFVETFEGVNTPENMHKYLANCLNIETLSGELINDNSAFYLAIYKDKNIGYLKINFGNAQTEIKDEISIEIERIYVLKEYQGKNVGLLLLNYAFEIARKLKMKYVWLGVWEENYKAIDFYKKYGFVPFDSHEFILGNSVQTDILMKRDVF